MATTTKFGDNLYTIPKSSGGIASPITAPNNAFTGARPSTGGVGGMLSGAGAAMGSTYTPSTYDAGGGGAVPGVTDLTAPYTGFASRYTPGSAEMLFGNPDVILKDVVRDMGMPGAGGGYFMAQPYMNYANALFALANGGGTDMANGANDVGINYLADYARQLLTPGGQGVQFNQGLSALQN